MNGRGTSELAQYLALDETTCLIDKKTKHKILREKNKKRKRQI